MKKTRNIAIVSGVLVLMQIVLGGRPLLWILGMWPITKLYMQGGAASIGIIGSADGPTGIYVGGGALWPGILFFVLCLLTFIVSTIQYVRLKRNGG